MPKFKSVITGLALSTAMTGAVVGIGTLTTTAHATTAAALMGHGGNQHDRHKNKVRVWIRNNNQQSQRQFEKQDQDQDEDQDQCQFHSRSSFQSAPQSSSQDPNQFLNVLNQVPPQNQVVTDFDDAQATAAQNICGLED